jgi:hypothetical protein
MNIRQSSFAALVASGMPPARAYFEAGYSALGKAAETRAARLLKNDAVVERIAEILGVDPIYARMSKIRKIRFLEKIIASDTAEDCDRIAAIKIHNLMVGDHAPTRIEVDGGPEMLKAIREGPMTIEEALSVIARNAKLED